MLKEKLNKKIIPAVLSGMMVFGCVVPASTVVANAGTVTEPNITTSVEQTDEKSFTVKYLGEESYVWSGVPIEPEVEVYDVDVLLTEGVDYTVEYEGSSNVGGSGCVWVWGIGEYDGLWNQNCFNIIEETVEKEIYKITSVEVTKTYTYTGKTIEPTDFSDGLHVWGTDEEGNAVELSPGDYDIVGYKNNVNAGTATVTIKGIGNYKGKYSTNFTIKKRNIKDSDIKIYKSEMLVEESYLGTWVFNGKAKKFNFSLFDNNSCKYLGRNVNYKISYSNNVNTGIAKVTFTGIGKNYTGTKVLTFKIAPKKAKIKSIRIGKKAFTVTSYKNYGKVTGYEVKYARNGSSKYKTKYVSGTTCKVKGLKAKTTYKVKVRAYKKVGKVKIYGAWSTIKKIKTK